MGVYEQEAHPTHLALPFFGMVSDETQRYSSQNWSRFIWGVRNDFKLFFLLHSDNGIFSMLVEISHFYLLNFLIYSFFRNWKKIINWEKKLLFFTKKKSIDSLQNRLFHVTPAYLPLNCLTCNPIPVNLPLKKSNKFKILRVEKKTPSIRNAKFEFQIFEHRRWPISGGDQAKCAIMGA